MFRKQESDGEQLKSAIHIVNESMANEAIKKANAVKAAKAIKRLLTNQIVLENPIHVYESLKKSFVIEASMEMKRDSLKDDLAFRELLLHEGPAVKSEEAYTKALSLLLQNPSFHVTDIIRFFRRAERNLASAPDPVTVEDPEALSSWLPSLYGKNDFTIHLETAQRPLVFPEDRELVHITPKLLIYRGRMLGVTGPELLSFDDLVKTLISLPEQ